VAEVCNVMASLRKEGVTMILVTHQIEFAKKISSKTLFLSKGEVDCLGPTEEVFTNPTPTFKQFLSAEANLK
ncbi:MAG: hypothetical protein K6F32_05500, partial [Bacilli bacterium]|nr:hypothetical protein [Bacilli bacterium]